MVLLQGGEFDWSVKSRVWLACQVWGAKYVLEYVSVWFWCILLAFSWFGVGRGWWSVVKTLCDAVVGRGVKPAAFVLGDKKMPGPKAVLPLSSPRRLCLHHCKKWFQFIPEEKGRSVEGMGSVVCVCACERREARRRGSRWMASCVVIRRLSPPGWGKKTRIKTVSVLKMWPPHHRFFCLVGTRKEFTDLSSARHYPDTPPPPAPPPPFLSHRRTYTSLFFPKLSSGFLPVTLGDLHPRPDTQ